MFDMSALVSDSTKDATKRLWDLVSKASAEMEADYPEVSPRLIDSSRVTNKIRSRSL
jgi:hypothetical protein